MSDEVCGWSFDRTGLEFNHITGHYVCEMSTDFLRVPSSRFFSWLRRRCEKIIKS
jgi:hypothetical protein